jgi:hypothetical protein
MSELNDTTCAWNVRWKLSGSLAHPLRDGCQLACTAAAADSAGVGGKVRGASAKGDRLGIVSRVGQSGDMRSPHGLRWFFLVISLVILVGMSACAVMGALPFSGDSWKEEVLLHDGSTLLITRSQTYGGRHEIGQPPSIKEHTVTFTLSNSNKRITWTSEYDKKLRGTNFHLLAVHMLNGTPYIVTEPNLCPSYRKWGRPNPPYVFFKYDGTTWQRIPLEDVPTEFTSMNVVISLSRQFVDAMVKQRVVPVEQVQKWNSQLLRPAVRTILREPEELGSAESLTSC